MAFQQDMWKGGTSFVSPTVTLAIFSIFMLSCSASPQESSTDEPPWDLAAAHHYPTRGDEAVLSKEDSGEDVWCIVPNHVSTAIDHDGNPTGLKISDDPPKNSVLRRLGFRGGDLILSINGTFTTDIACAKHLLIKLRDEGVNEFSVLFERSGAARTIHFRLAKD